jgi:hypothetical protein
VVVETTFRFVFFFQHQVVGEFDFLLNECLTYPNSSIGDSCKTVKCRILSGDVDRIEEGFTNEIAILSLNPTILCIDFCTCTVQLVISITIELSFNCIFLYTSHCNFTFNQQHLYWRLFVSLDVETTIFINPNLVQEILMDFDQNTSREICENVEPHEFGCSCICLNNKMPDNVRCNLYRHIVCSFHFQFQNVELVIVESMTDA